jgi:hypothetical protein
LSILGCGGKAISTSAFGVAAPAQGEVTLENALAAKPISGLVFENQGTASITIDSIQVVLASSATIDSAAGLSVQARGSATLLFSPSLAQRVTSVGFVVHGSTETLRVLGAVEAGVTGGSSCGISASNYDQSCTTDADCVAVYQGEVCSTECSCPNAVINQRALAQYWTDFSKEDHKANVCDCALSPTPRCMGSICSL